MPRQSWLPAILGLIIVAENIGLIVLTRVLLPDKWEGTAAFFTCGFFSPLTVALLPAKNWQLVRGCFLTVPVTLVSIFVGCRYVSQKSLFAGRTPNEVFAATIILTASLIVMAFVSGSIVCSIRARIDSARSASLFARVRIGVSWATLIVGLGVGAALALTAGVGVYLSRDLVLGIVAFAFAFALISGGLTAVAYPARASSAA